MKFKTHKTIRLSNKVLGMQADIDIGLAPHIREIWKAGIQTRFCCQNLNQSGKAQISFATAEDAICFLEIVARSKDKSLLKRMGRFTKTPWEYTIYPYDLNHMWADLTKPNPCIDFTIHIHFPISDKKLILKQLKEHNAHFNDFLNEIEAEWTKKDPEFPRLVEEALKNKS